MKKYSIEERAKMLAEHIISTKDTVRTTAKKFGISKSTVHKERSELQKNKISGYIEFPQASKNSIPIRVTLAVRM